MMSKRGAIDFCCSSWFTSLKKLHLAACDDSLSEIISRTALLQLYFEQIKDSP